VLRNLSYSQRLQWDARKKNIKDGQSKIDNGNWLLNTKPRPNTPAVGIKEAMTPANNKWLKAPP